VSYATRKYMAALSALLLGVVLAEGMIDMPAAGQWITSYGLLLSELSLTERNAMNSVAGVLFDLRALDTLGEILVMYTAAAGLHIVLLKLSIETVRDEPIHTLPGRAILAESETIRTLCYAVATPLALYGVYSCVRGHLTVGGGFQGGVIVAAVLFMLYFAGQYRIQKLLAGDETLDVGEVLGMGGVVLIAMLGLVLGGSLFYNILPAGSPGELLSAGLIPLLSILVGLEAAAAVTMIISHLQRQPLKREKK